MNYWVSIFWIFSEEQMRPYKEILHSASFLLCFLMYEVIITRFINAVAYKHFSETKIFPFKTLKTNYYLHLLQLSVSPPFSVMLRCIKVCMCILSVRWCFICKYTFVIYCLSARLTSSKDKLKQRCHFSLHRLWVSTKAKQPRGLLLYPLGVWWYKCFFFDDGLCFWG